MSIQSLMSGPEPLWTLLDQYIVELCQEWAKGILELNPCKVEIGEQYDPSVLEIPLIMVTGIERTMSEGQPLFGDGEYHIDGLTYPYEVHVVTNWPTEKEAKIFAIKASGSLTDAFRANPTFGGLMADNGEYVKHFDYDDGEVFVRGIAGQELGNYTSVAVIRLVVHTEI